MLHRINLLPWRAQQRKANQQRFIILLVGCLLLALFSLSSIGFYIETQQQLQQQRLNYLQSHLDALQSQQRQRAKLEQQHQTRLAQIRQLAALQAQRNKGTKLSNLIAKLLPDGVYLDRITMQGQRIEIIGLGDSTSRLAIMLEQFEQSPWFSKVTMHSIEPNQIRFEQPYQTFHVSFYLHLTGSKQISQSQPLIHEHAKVGGDD